MNALSGAAASTLEIASMVPLSTSDWPGKVVTTVFLQGCPWRCNFCYNQDLLDPHATGVVSWHTVVDHLERRTAVLDGIVFSGGEPTRQRGLYEAMAEAKLLGFEVGLHTGGAFPLHLERVLPIVDWVALDIKAAAQGYEAITGVESSGVRAWQSLDALLHSGVQYEIRMTVDPTVHIFQDVEYTAYLLDKRGAKPPVLQEALPQGTRAEYRRELAGRRLCDVVPDHALPHLERRIAPTR